MTYPSRLRRLAGWIIEFVVVFALLFLGLLLAGQNYFIGFVIGLTAVWLYFAGLESSSRQATLSGPLLGVRVTDLEGERLTFTHATGRHFAMYVSAVTPFFIGYWMAFWTRRRQTLHDLLARTLVVKN